MVGGWVLVKGDVVIIYSVCHMVQYQRIFFIGRYESYLPVKFVILKCQNHISASRVFYALVSLRSLKHLSLFQVRTLVREAENKKTEHCLDCAEQVLIPPIIELY